MSGPVGHSGEGGLDVAPGGPGADQHIARWIGGALTGSTIVLDDSGRFRTVANVSLLDYAGTILTIGGIAGGATKPGTIMISALSSVQLYTADVLRFYVVNGRVQTQEGLFQFAHTAGPIQIQQDDNGADGAVGNLRTDNGQDVTSLAAAATVGGARLSRAGDASGPAGVGGAYLNRPGGGPAGGGDYAIADGAANVNLQVDDAGTHNLRAWSVKSTQLTNAGSPYTPGPADIIIYCMSLTGPTAVDLPPAAAMPDRWICVKDHDNNAAAAMITVSPVAGDTIDQVAAPDVFRANGECMWYHSDGGTNWARIGHFH